MYSCRNLALNYIEPNYYRSATAAFPKSILMVFIMLKMEFRSAFLTAAVVLKISSLFLCGKNVFVVWIAQAVKIGTIICEIPSE